jgi:hypothetical protein
LSVQLGRGSASVTEPFAELRCNGLQAFRAKDKQPYEGQQHELGEPDVEHVFGRPLQWQVHAGIRPLGGQAFYRETTARLRAATHIR